MLTDDMLDALPTSPAGRETRWLLERLAAVCVGETAPDAVELEQHFTGAWLAEVPMRRTFDEIAPLMKAVTAMHSEEARLNEAAIVLQFGDEYAMRVRCAVEDAVPHRINFQLFSRAMSPSSYVDRVVERDGRSVRARDFGGNGPLLLLWHGAGCDATVWEALVPSLHEYRVVAQDLPGHGRSLEPHLTVADTVADTRALLDELETDRPILVGHSMGGWIALHYAATFSSQALVCLDGPTNLDYSAMGLATDHPGWMPDPPDVRTDLDALNCPTLITLCSGASPAEAEWMVPFRSVLSDYLAAHHPEIRVEWQPTGHMNVLSMPQQTADLIAAFA